MGNYFLVYIIIQQHFYTAAAIRYNKQVPVTEIIHTLLFSTHHFVIWLMVKMVVCYCCFEYWGGEVHDCNTAESDGGTRHTKYEAFIWAVKELLE